MSDLLPTDGSEREAAEKPAGEYVVIARRYRPQSFAELIGQDHVAKGLAAAIATSRVGHAYLFTGARGTGKTSTARILAKSLNCEHGPTPTPCNQCDICQAITAGSDMDVLEIDGASNRGIDEIRQLRQNVNVRPSRSRFKIYIIDEVHMLTEPAFNALLKTLEEPPEHVKFIFCTTEADKIPITILSRCQRFDFAGIQTKQIVERLRQIAESEGVAADPEALEVLARRAAGSMRDSQSLLEQLLAFGSKTIGVADVHALLGTAGSERIAKLVSHLIERNPAGALGQLDEAATQGVDVGQLLDQLLGYFRDVMATAVGCPSDNLLHVSPSEAPAIQAAAKQLGLETVLAMMQILDQTMARMKYLTYPRLVAELALVRLCTLDDLDSLPNLIAQLRDGLPAAAPGGSGGTSSSGAASSAVASKKKFDGPVVSGLGAPSAASPPANDPSTHQSAASKPSENGFSANGSSANGSSSNGVHDNGHHSLADSTEPSPAALNGHSQNGHSTSENGNSTSENGHIDVEADEQLIQNGGSNGELPNLPSAPAVGGLPPAIGAPPSSADAGSNVDLAGITPAAALNLWRRAAEQLGGLAAEKAGQAMAAELELPDQLVVSFAKRYNFCMQFCERQEIASQLAGILGTLAGRTLRLKYRMQETEAEEPAVPRAVSQRQRLHEVCQKPFVRKAIELFDANPQRLEEPTA